MQSPEKYAQLIGDLQRGISYGYVDPEKWRNGTISNEQALQTFNSLWYDNYYNKGISYDWQKALFNKSSFTQGHNISISQNTDKMQYRLSYSFQEDNSYYKTLSFQRHIINNSVDMKFAKWISAGMITRLSLRENSGWPDNMWDNMRRMSPFETPWIDEDPSRGLKPKVGKEQYINAMWNYEPGYLVDERSNRVVDLIFKVDIKPFSWLTFTTNLKLGYGERKRGQYRDSYTSYQNGGKNWAEMNKNGSSNYTWNGILSFDKTFGVHKLNATAVMEAIQEKEEWVTASSQDIPAQYMDYHFLDAGPTNKSVSSGFGRNNLLSYMGRFQYELMGKYLFNVAIRADGSSRLAEGNKWRSFPSASAAWWISEEGFLKNNPVISSLKLRASYGEIGNQAIDSYQTLERLKSKTYSWNKSGIYTWQPDGLANKALTWEVSKTFNTGFDFGFLKNRIGGTIEYYYTRTTGLLMQRQLPESTGFGSIWQNIGETENQGVEFTLNAYPIQRKEMNWSITGTFSRNFNRIVSLYDGLQMNTSEKWFVGQPIKLYWEYQRTGIWQSEEADQAKVYKTEPGLAKIKDQQKEGEPGYGVINDDDRIFLGQVEPKFMVALQSGFQWKQVDVSINIVSQGGHLIQASNYTSEWNGDKYIIDAIDWWTPLNRSNDWPRIHTAQGTNNSETFRTWKGDFVKVQDISIGYDFMKMAKSKWKNLGKLRLYFQARNPFYIYRACPGDVNPEQPNTMYTIPASYVMGLNLSF